MSTTWRPLQLVRPLAIGIIRRGEGLLVAAVQDDAGTIKGWRPLGGSIEFGERAADTLRRELIEELGLAIAQPKLLTVVPGPCSDFSRPCCRRSSPPSA